MRWPAPSERLRLAPPRAVTLGNALRLHIGLAVLAVMCLAITPLCSLLGLVLPSAHRGRFVRGVIRWIFGTHLALMERAGIMKLDLSELDALRDGPAVVVAPNHPSMIDAALLLSRLSRLTCIMKADILHNPLFGAGARMAGYITNDPPRQMMRAAGETLQGGRHLLLFPEGTRTQQLPVNPLQRTVGVIARRAAAPVQTVFIETPSPFLCKGWPLFRVPAMPMVYRVRLGRRFDPPTDVDAFAQELEDYFREQLAGSRLPVLPLKRDAR